MKKIHRAYRMEPIPPSVLSDYYNNYRPCVFDIETTGLSQGRHTSRVIMTAMLIQTAEGIEVTQYLAENPYEEDQVLRHTLQFFADHGIDYLITYNGASFDIPFMNRRLDALHFPFSIRMYNLDLLAWLRKNTVLPHRLTSLSQKQVEHFFGIGGDRNDRISGRESVRLYYEYVAGAQPMLEKILLTHNREDVLQLYRLFRRVMSDRFSEYLSYPDDAHRAETAYGFPAAKHAALSVRPQLQRGNLVIRGQQFQPLSELIAERRNAPKRAALRKQEDVPSISADPALNDYSDIWSGAEYEPCFPLSASLFPDIHSNLSVEFRGSTADYEIRVPISAHQKSDYVDLRDLSIPPESFPSIESLDGYVNGYLILSEDGEKKYRELNTLSAIISGQTLKRVRSLYSNRNGTIQTLV